MPWYSTVDHIIFFLLFVKTILTIISQSYALCVTMILQQNTMNQNAMTRQLLGAMHMGMLLWTRIVVSDGFRMSRVDFYAKNTMSRNWVKNV